MKNILVKVFNKIKRILGIKTKKVSPIEYWKKRAKQYGERSVFNISHTEDELLSITKMQKDKLFPIFRKQLNGNKRLLLDFGCGTGRFSSDLAKIIKGKVIGVDPTEDLIDLARQDDDNGDVKYMLMDEGIIPLNNSSVDIAWICLVLGGIVEEQVLRESVKEIKRVLKNNGLIFVIENTQNQKDGDYWKFRTVEYYQSLFKFAHMKHLSDYYDKDEKISIMSGRVNV